MKASTMTLDDALNVLPRTLRQRYSGGNFPQSAGNIILGELEKELEDKHFIGETGLLLKANTTDYVLPATVRQIRGLYMVLAGDVSPYRAAPVPFQELGTTLRLEAVPTLSENEDITGTIPAGGDGSLLTLFDDTAGKLDEDTLDEDALAGRYLQVTHLGGTVESRILSGNTPEDTTADINGALLAEAAEGDSYLITSNFLVMEVLNYLTRFTETTDTLPIPQDWEACFIAYLRYKYEAQSEEGSTNTAFWFREARRELNTIKADGRHRRDNPVRRGRALPPFFT